MSVYKNRRHDEQVADDVSVDRSLMCPANGCPNRWTVQGEQGRACSAHYGAPTFDWPRITQEQQDAQITQARRNMASGPTSTAPLTREGRFAILCKLRDVGHQPKGTSSIAWAHDLRARHMAGARLTQQQIAAYSEVLAKVEKRTTAVSAQPFDLPPVAPPMPPAIELPPVDAYSEERQP